MTKIILTTSLTNQAAAGRTYRGDVPAELAGRWCVLAFRPPSLRHPFMMQVKLHSPDADVSGQQEFIYTESGNWHCSPLHLEVRYLMEGYSRAEVNLWGASRGEPDIAVQACPVRRVFASLMLMLCRPLVFARSLFGQSLGGAGRIRSALRSAAIRVPPKIDYAFWAGLFDVWPRSEVDRLFRPARSDLPPLILACVFAKDARTAAAEASRASLQAQTRPPTAILQASPAKPDELRRTLAASPAEYVALVQAGEVIPDHALALLSNALSELEWPAILYADEDGLDARGRRVNPLFKPEPNLPLMQSGTLTSGLWLVRRTLLLECSDKSLAWAETARMDSWLRAYHANQSAATHRVPYVLTHRRPDAESAPVEALARCVSAHLEETGIIGAVEPGFPLRIARRLPPKVAGKVSIVIASSCRSQKSVDCIGAVLSRTKYPSFEVIIVISQPRPLSAAQLAVLRQIAAFGPIRYEWLQREPFNYSAANNFGVSLADGDYVCLLNDDVKPMTDTWLQQMVAFFAEQRVGIIGAKLYYPDMTVQHGGVIVGLAGLAEHMYRRLPRGEPGYAYRAVLNQELSVVTGACLLVPRALYHELGDLDEAYAIGFNDVDFCFRAREAGWRIILAAEVEMLHYESLTFGPHYADERKSQEAIDVARMLKRWPAITAADPFHNPNLSLAVGDEWGLAFPPRRIVPWDPTVAPPIASSIDVWDDRDVQRAVGNLPRDAILWSPQPASLIQDRWSAARWTLDLLRRGRDLRVRFPRALSGGADGPFAIWLHGEGGQALGLSAEARIQLQTLFDRDISARLRNIYFEIKTINTRFPLGLLPSGIRALAVWLLRGGRQSQGVRLEEIWWFLLRSAEDPTRELIRTYCFTPGWQQEWPDGLTVFGGASFAAGLVARWRLPSQAAWLQPNSWSSRMPPADQLRLAYAARPSWSEAHPNAMHTEADAQALLLWLSGPDSPIDAHSRAWCAERLSDGVTAASLAAPGINVIASFCYPSGLRVSAESMSNAMEIAGAAVSRRDMRTDPCDDPFHTDIGGLEVHDITLIHVQPEPFFPAAYQRADLAERSPRTYRIAYWYWELETCPTSWAETAATVDEVWAATEFVSASLRTVLPVPVRTMFPGVRIGQYTPRPREAFGLPGKNGAENRFAFLFSFHMGSIMERKNPLGLITAFKQAFTPDEPVDLVLKINSFGRYDNDVAALREAAAGANIHVLDRVMTPDEILSLTDACDAYISLHRSEGLGLTMAEAMLLGKPVIATRYSGNLDFMTDENSLLVDCSIVPLGRPYPPYDEASRWAEPSLDHAAQLMRRLYTDRAYAAELGARGQADAQRRLSLAQAGQAMVARLKEIRSPSNKPPA